MASSTTTAPWSTVSSQRGAHTVALSDLDGAMSEVVTTSTRRPDFRRVASERDDTDVGSTLAPTASFKTWSVTSTEPGQGPFHLERAAGRSVGVASSITARDTYFQPIGAAPPVPPLPDDYAARRYSAVSEASSTIVIPPTQLPARSQPRVARSGHVRRPSSPRDLHHDDVAFQPTHTRQSSSQRSLDWLLPPGYPSSSSSPTPTPHSTVRSVPAPPPTVAGMTESTSWSKAFAAGLDAPRRGKVEALPASHDIERRIVEDRGGCRWLSCFGDRAAARRGRPQQRRRWLLIDLLVLGCLCGLVAAAVVLGSGIGR